RRVAAGVYRRDDAVPRQAGPAGELDYAGEARVGERRQDVAPLEPAQSSQRVGPWTQPPPHAGERVDLVRGERDAVLGEQLHEPPTVDRVDGGPRAGPPVHVVHARTVGGLPLVEEEDGVEPEHLS